ncbi:orotidine-5'-phosphate decarboxylase [Betaproteobacteria bacterium PRO4]|uniref:orotidine-5'-phosphate decarboxylase n=1 Tax=Nitrosomonas sp. TaxID=42353 RepID=UPI00256E971C|nr:orotidine-5'-phosphate decarboxylase [Nitrosomonas sp.]MDL1867144.1 orotidine-5'-phosphate decarboxylase [Betaproteobacteria bacterium PRO4]
MNDPRIIVALDFSDPDVALNFAAQLDSALCRVKVGKELFTLVGPQLVEKLMKLGFDIFLDLKFHDIPNTVAAACHAASSLGVWMVNVHALGGSKMLTAARQALEGKKTRLIAVTLLTSLAQDDLTELGFIDTAESMAQRLALLTQRCGLDGVVCSALEAARLRKVTGADFLLVTPGIRSVDDSKDDQARIATPAMAIHNGANYLVIGRPITRSSDPLKALQRFNDEIMLAV